MKTMKASEFKVKCLAVMDEIAVAGESLVMIKNGRPVAELRPYTGERLSSPFGLHKGKIETLGDIKEPIDIDGCEALS
jgi:antitoxin (DNA-binding transcriptional repressor) of toxin-antitoxin stability system